MFDWNDLQIFLAVATEGSALGASKVLGINQSTVSRRIQTLELVLKITLFDRQSKGHTLTENGAALFSFAMQMADQADALRTVAAQQSRTISGTIRVTAVEAIFNVILFPIIVEFKRLHPEVHIEQAALLNYVDIAGGEADVAFRAGSPPDDPQLIVQRLLDNPWGVYCSKQYAQRAGIPSGPDQLCDHDVITHQGSLRTWPGYQWFEKQIDPKRVVSSSSGIMSMPSLLQTGMGIGTMAIMQEDQVPGLLLCLLPPEMLSPFWLVTSQQARKITAVRAFIDFSVPLVLEKQRAIAAAASAYPQCSTRSS